jgi:PBP1b-binding outer membrane lipoprotein LpoB
MKKLVLVLSLTLLLASCSYDDTYNQTIVQQQSQQTTFESYGYLNTLEVGKIVAYNKSLNDFLTAEGKVIGTAINNPQLSPSYHIRKVYGSGNNVIRVTLQFQVLDAGLTKTVCVELNQSGDNVLAKITNAWHSIPSAFTTDFDSLTEINWSTPLVSGTKRHSSTYNGLTSTSGYGCNYVKLTFNK